MTKEIGLWIDHKRAVIVTDFSEESTLQNIDSNMEKRVRYAVSRPGGGAKPHQISSENGRDRRFNNHLDTYYDKIITLLRDATAILILGPGEAKTELQNRLKLDSTLEASVVIQSADKLTDPQIVAEVRQHFQPHNATHPQTTNN